MIRLTLDEGVSPLDDLRVALSREVLRTEIDCYSQQRCWHDGLKKWWMWDFTSPGPKEGGLMPDYNDALDPDDGSSSLDGYATDWRSW